MSAYPKYDDPHNDRAATAQFDSYDTSARSDFPAPETQSIHHTEYSPYSPTGDVKSTRDDARSMFADPSRATLVAEDDDPFAKHSVAAPIKDDESVTRSASRRYEDLGM